MKKLFKSVWLSLIVTCVLSVSCALAFTPSKLAVGVGGSRLYENIDTGSNPIVFEESAGFNFKLGYRFTEALEAELDYLYIDGFDGSVAGIKAFNLDGYAVTANAKWYPATGKVQPYCLVGAGFADLTARFDLEPKHKSESHADAVFRVGGGVDIYAAENVLFFGEISYYMTRGEVKDTDFMPVTLGVKRTF